MNLLTRVLAGWSRRRTGHQVPSRTSQAVALARAGFSRPHTPDGDPDAQRRLCAGMRPADIGPMRHSLAARTRFFDQQVLAAIDAGVAQVVIVGAGYDDRGLRFRVPGVRFFEVDHPATQSDKASRLREMTASIGDLTLAAADFRTDDVACVLSACGHDAARPSLFVCEGLLVYLDGDTGIRLLAGLRARAAPGSTLAVSLAAHRPGIASEQAVTVANARRRTADAEPWLTIRPADAYPGFLDQAGWRIDGAFDASRLDAGVPAGRSLLVTAHPRNAEADPADRDRG
jgi:methyltransferase (TIGR00027 family)